MAPILNIFRRDDDDMELSNTTAYYLLLTFTILFFVGCTCLGALLMLRKARRSKQTQDIEASPTLNKTHRRSRNTTSISIINEKSAFLEDEPYSPTESVPEIRITFPDEPSADGKRQSRVVIVKIGEKGAVGYEPYEEPLPVYKEKESSQFQNLDLERIGGLKEKDTKA